MADSALAAHVRSVQALASEVASEGRYDDAWQILRDSVASVLAASRSASDHKVLKLAVRLAEQENDMTARTNILLQAYDEVLDKSSKNHTTLLSQTILRSPPRTPLSRRPDPLGETPDRMRNSLPRFTLDRKSSMQRAFDDEQEPSPRPERSKQSDYKSSWEGLPPAGKSQMRRASSAPYFAQRPLRGQQILDDDRDTKSSRGTSHYTTLAAPRTNSHYIDSLPGGNWEFGCSRNPWKTTSQAFHKPQELDTTMRFSGDRNFQYVDGEKCNGVASVRQRVRLPAHHSSPYLL